MLETDVIIEPKEQVIEEKKAESHGPMHSGRMQAIFSTFYSVEGKKWTRKRLGIPCF